MGNKKKIFSALFFLLLLYIASASALDISTCDYTVNDSGTYDLTNDLVIGSLTQCIRVYANDTIIDCHGYAINLSGNLTTSAIFFQSVSDGFGYSLPMHNLTVQNCIFNNFSMGIYGSRTSDIIINNNEFYDLTERNGRGVQIESKGTNLSNIIIENNEFVRSNNSVWSAISITPSNASCPIVGHTNNIQILNNNVIGYTSVYGLIQIAGTYNCVQENYYGRYINESSNIIISGNSMINSTSSSISGQGMSGLMGLGGVSGVEIYNNYIYNCTNCNAKGIYVYGMAGTTNIYNNYINYTSGGTTTDGIAISGSIVGLTSEQLNIHDNVIAGQYYGLNLYHSNSSSTDTGETGGKFENVNIYNNNISSVVLRGMMLSALNNSEIYNNIDRVNLLLRSDNVKFHDNTIVNVAVCSDGDNIDIYNNDISNTTANGISIAVNVNCLDTLSVNISNNKIHNTFYGINFTSSANFHDVYNNNIYNNSVNVFGINARNLSGNYYSNGGDYDWNCNCAVLPYTSSAVSDYNAYCLFNGWSLSSQCWAEKGIPTVEFVAPSPAVVSPYYLYTHDVAFTLNVSINKSNANTTLFYFALTNVSLSNITPEQDSFTHDQGNYWSRALTVTAEGFYYYRLWANDTYGNSDYSEFYWLYVDNVNPQITYTYPAGANTTIATTTGNILITGQNLNLTNGNFTVRNVANVLIYNASISGIYAREYNFTTAMSSIFTGQPDGIYTFHTCFVDLVNNTDCADAKLQLLNNPPTPSPSTDSSYGIQSTLTEVGYGIGIMLEALRTPLGKFILLIALISGIVALMVGLLVAMVSWINKTQK